MNTSRHGFSLVELSIVLVILGLLTGGILAGQSLIRAAELRSISSDYQRYVTAVSTFRDKYFALPGDFAKATSFWTASGTCPGVSGTAAAGVCNGDGSGVLQQIATPSNELFGAWEHLALAGLIEGSYSGNTGDASVAINRTPIYGTNAPRSKISSAGWMFHSQGTITVVDTLFFEGDYNNILSFGTVSPNGYGPAIKPEEAWNIDTKMDDGKPGLGRVRMREDYGTTCTDLPASGTTAASLHSYLLTNNAIACNILFLGDF